MPKYFAAVFKEDIEKGQGIVYFNMKFVNPNFANFQVPMKAGEVSKAENKLLKLVKAEYPNAKIVYQLNSSFIEK